MNSILPGIGFSYPPASPITPGAGLGDLSGGGDNAASPGFQDVLKNTLQNVNQLERGAHQQVNMVLQGGGGGDVSGVMIAVEKADVAFQLMMQVRNKIVSAYQDVEKMQF
jgi:flagellar hook-basal body complex protein FliE